jgi:hypothetical protein
LGKTPQWSAERRAGPRYGSAIPSADGRGHAARLANGCGVPRPRISALRFPRLGVRRVRNRQFGTTVRRDAPRGNAPARLNNARRNDDAEIEEDNHRSAVSGRSERDCFASLAMTADVVIARSAQRDEAISATRVGLDVPSAGPDGARAEPHFGETNPGFRFGGTNPRWSTEVRFGQTNPKTSMAHDRHAEGCLGRLRGATDLRYSRLHGQAFTAVANEPRHSSLDDLEGNAS